MANSTSLERVRYFPRQLMTAEDMRTEQDYFLERLRRHNRMMHGWGVVCGLKVTAAPTNDQPWRVSISAGVALSPEGDEIELPCGAKLDGSDAAYFDFAQPPGDYGDGCIPCPCPPLTRTAETTTPRPTVDYLAIRYRACDARPTRVDYGRCGCPDNGCETTRYRDDFAFALLSKLPSVYIEQEEQSPGSGAQLLTPPIRDCRACDAELGPYIVLAQVTGDKTIPSGSNNPFAILDLRRGVGA